MKAFQQCARVSVTI